MPNQPFEGMRCAVDDGLGAREHYVWTAKAPPGYSNPNPSGLYKVLVGVEWVARRDKLVLPVEHLRF